jgi:hypothetical protein
VGSMIAGWLADVSVVTIVAVSVSTFGSVDMLLLFLVSWHRRSSCHWLSAVVDGSRVEEILKKKPQIINQMTLCEDYETKILVTCILDRQLDIHKQNRPWPYIHETQSLLNRLLFKRLSHPLEKFEEFSGFI